MPEISLKYLRIASFHSFCLFYRGCMYCHWCFAPFLLFMFFTGQLYSIDSNVRLPFLPSRLPFIEHEPGKIRVGFRNHLELPSTNLLTCLSFERFKQWFLVSEYLVLDNSLGLSCATFTIVMSSLWHFLFFFFFTALNFTKCIPPENGFIFARKIGF